jgi:ABC-type multidrug transport system fused ATPase/permease subunit
MIINMTRLQLTRPPAPLDHLPHVDPGTPELSNVRAFMFWLARGQTRLLASGVFFGIIWMVGQAAIPVALGRGVEALTKKDTALVAYYAGAVIVFGTIQGFAGIMRHRRAVANWMTAANRIQQLLARKASYLGGDLSRQVATGEVVAVNANDVEKIARAFDVIPRFIGAIVAFVIIALVLLTSSVLLGALVLIGVPLLALFVGPLLRPLQRREAVQRAKLGRTTELAADTVAGLRVLRGIGGEELFLARFVEASQEVRRAAVRTAQVRAVLDAMQVALPGFFVVVVIWVGAHLALKGTLTVGQLVTFYGLSAFLVMPLRTMTETAQKWTAASVSAGRVLTLLRLERHRAEPTDPQSLDASGELVDAVSGIEIHPGRFTAIACDEPEMGDVIADRLGGYRDAHEVTLGSVRLDQVEGHTLTKTILVQDKDPVLLSGTLAALLDVPSTGRVEIATALAAASAEDIMDSLDGEGMQAAVVERGRTLSGGQRQRLALARSLIADPPILVLDEPTSAVDAHTEARVAAALAEVRGPQTTVVLSTSPLLLDRADEVIFVLGGRAVDRGTHTELSRRNEDYRRLVVRDV